MRCLFLHGHLACCLGCLAFLEVGHQKLPAISNIYSSTQHQELTDFVNYGHKTVLLNVAVGRVNMMASVLPLRLQIGVAFFIVVCVRRKWLRRGDLNGRAIRNTQ
ncbi:hypothetical protein [Mesorhizobium temperatum]|uniref:hypothetical protein n=1 Tax=Mesorhizobium temperatum TaxID=241416 RepID=UPI00142E6AD3|nr:hypothetical protein [Mesorhizobium temperatum]